MYSEHWYKEKNMTSFYFRQANEYDPNYGMCRKIYINNYGFYRNISKNLETYRKDGRCDYHLLYVSCGEILANGTVLKNGEFYIYTPNETQNYTYLTSCRNSLYYWVHFTGSMIPEIMENLNLSKRAHSCASRQNEADLIFQMLTEELSRGGTEASQYAISLFHTLLSLFSEPGRNKYPFSRAINILEDFSKDVRVDEIAKIYDITTAHFIRSFKNSYGITPAKYRIRKQISHAKNLLIETELSISDVSLQCGIPDQFYFSRIFKINTGTTPSDYRRGSREKTNKINH